MHLSQGIMFAGSRKTYKIFLEEEDIKHIPKCINEIMTEKAYESLTVKIEPGDIVLDGGAYLGIFTYYALECGARKVIAFEPHKRKFNLLQEAIKENGLVKQVKLYNKALWSVSNLYKRFLVYNRSPMVSKLSDPDEKHTYKIVTTAIDDLDFRLDFIKLDVEGAELAAIAGARNVLQFCRPKLAVCLYHKKDDMKIIPEVLKNYGYGKPQINGDKYKVGVWGRAN